jgi:uncharacterized DUF497 family protein
VPRSTILGVLLVLALMAGDERETPPSPDVGLDVGAALRDLALAQTSFRGWRGRADSANDDPQATTWAATSVSLARDEKKDRAKRKKHGISFAEAHTVFYDENALEFEDPDHPASEGRFLLLGLSLRLRVLLICHCYREKESIIRVISARRATRKERAVYARKGKP